MAANRLVLLPGWRRLIKVIIDKTVARRAAAELPSDNCLHPFGLSSGAHLEAGSRAVS